MTSSRPGLQASLAVLLLSASACGESECLIPPCASPVALELTVTGEITGTPVAGVSIAVTGPATGGGPCPEARCVVMGGAGTYELDLSAPGYQSIHRSVVVQGTTPECGCPTVETQRLTIVLPRVTG
jgi:hypothetical protein